MTIKIDSRTEQSLLHKLDCLMIDISEADLIFANNEYVSNYSGYPFVVCFSKRFIIANFSVLYNFYKSFVEASDDDSDGILWVGDKGFTGEAYMEFEESELCQVKNFFETALI